MQSTSDHHEENEALTCFDSPIKYVVYVLFLSGLFQNIMCVIIIMTNLCFPDVRFLKGDQRTKTYRPFVINFTFDSLYNSKEKFCCKLFPGKCDKLLDSTGFTSDSLKGRVQITEEDGWIEFKFCNVQDSDAGNYRCSVTEVQHLLYHDYTIELSG